MTARVRAPRPETSALRIRRELLVGLIRKDLKVKYQGSLLGFLWSLVNPLVLLVVYTFVFSIVLKSGIPHFGYYLMSALLIWNMFVGSVGSATEAVVANAGLVKKVRFPLDVLPMTAVGFNLVHFVLQLAVFVVVMVVTGFTGFAGPQLLLAVPAIAVALLFTVGLAYLVAALNVRYRDTKHLVEVVLMAGFWASPIVYSANLVHSRVSGTLFQLYLLDPMTAVATAMQRAFYGNQRTISPVLADRGYAFYLEHLGVAAVVSLLVLWLGATVFSRMAADFAEEL